MRNGIGMVVYVTLLLGIASSTVAHAAPGDFDTSFGVSGVRSVANGTETAYGQVVQAGGRYYAVGTTLVSGLRRPVITAFNTSGTVDTSFGTNGHWIDMGLSESVTSASATFSARVINLQARYMVYWVATSATKMYVYHSYVQHEGTLLSGGPPSGWGDGTRVTLTFPGGNVVPLADIGGGGYAPVTVVGAASQVSGGAQQGVILRLDWLTGAAVTTFGSGGRVYVAAGSVDRFAGYSGNCAVGRSQVSGDWDILVACFTATGLDVTFDGDGIKKFSLGFSGRPNELGRAILSSSGLYIAANTCDSAGGSCQVGLAKLTTSGAFDTSFDGDGKALHTLSANGLTLGSRRILLIGSRYYLGGQSFASDAVNSFLFAFTSSGAADSAFGTGGLRTFDHSSGFEGYAGMSAVDSDSRIVVAGDHDVGANVNGIVAKHLP